jgi:hypothetical protein
MALLALGLGPPLPISIYAIEIDTPILVFSLHELSTTTTLL